MGEILEIIFFMWLVAVASFAPLGYFIFLFTKGNGESFGKSNPADHSVEQKAYYHLVNNILGKILGEGEPTTGTAVKRTSSTPGTAAAARKSPRRTATRSRKK